MVEGSSSVRRWPHRRPIGGVEKPKINSRNSDAYLLGISGNLWKREDLQEKRASRHVPNPTQRYFQFYIHNNVLIPKEMWNLANSSSLVSGSWTPDRRMRCNCPHEKRSKNKQARQEAARSKRSKQKKECNEIPSFAACTLTKNTNSPVGRRQGEWTCMVSLPWRTSYAVVECFGRWTMHGVQILFT